MKKCDVFFLHLHHGIDPAERNGGQVWEQDDAGAGEEGVSDLQVALSAHHHSEHQVALNGEGHDEPGRGVEHSVLQEVYDAAPRVSVPERLRLQEHQAQVEHRHPHQVPRVHHRQTAQVHARRVRHATHTATQHVEGEEVRWRAKKKREGEERNVELYWGSHNCANVQLFPKDPFKHLKQISKTSEK